MAYAIEQYRVGGDATVHFPIAGNECASHRCLIHD
jgi:hypothetical protein